MAFVGILHILLADALFHSPSQSAEPIGVPIDPKTIGCTIRNTRTYPLTSRIPGAVNRKKTRVFNGTRIRICLLTQSAKRIIRILRYRVVCVGRGCQLSETHVPGGGVTLLKCVTHLNRIKMVNGM